MSSTDNVGNASTATTLTLTNDITGPTGGSISVPATVKTLSVTITSGNYNADAGSGVASNAITRSNGQAPVSGVCPASGYTGATTVTSPDTGVANGLCYVYTLTGTDNVSNTSTVTSSPVLVDTTAPTDTITLSAPSGAYKSGTTVYYKGNAAGSFKLQDAVADGAAGSGPASATFGALSGGSGFSTHNSETISTPSGGPYVSSTISWTSASGSPTIPVNGTDVAGNSSGATTLTLTLDNTNPAGGSISVPAYATSTSVTITSSNYTDTGGSGIASNTITRSNGQAPVSGVCPASGYSGSTVVSSPDSGVADGQCYVYTLTGTDNVGNTASVTSSPVMVDATKPTDAITITAATGAYKSGATIFYRGSAAGSFKLHDVSSDGTSGPASATFGTLSGITGATHSTETISTPAGGPYDSSAIAWSSASGAGSIPVHSTDAAGNSSSDTTLNLTNDSTGPTGGSIGVPAYVTTASVTITSSNYNADAGSGVASNAITRSAGQAPVAGVCPASGYSGFTGVSSPDTSVADGQCYVYTLTGTDNVGNTSTVTTSPVMVDTTKPTDAIAITAATGAYKSGTTVYYKGNAAGSFKLQDTVSDATSGSASATFGALSASGFTTHNSETVSTPAGGPYVSTAIQWTSSSASPTIAVSSNDAAGNGSTGTTLTLTNDTTAPSSGSISVPAYATSLSVTITSSNYTDTGGSGIASNVITRSNAQAPTAGVCPASGYSGATTVSSPDGGVANGQCYVYTLTGTDNVGNTASVTSSPVMVDTTAPTDAITLSGATGAYKSGTTVYYKGNAAGSFQLKDAVSDGISGPASATFGALSGGSGFSTHNSETVSTPAGGPYVSSAISWSSASGSPTIPVNGTDAAGNSSSATTLTLALDNTVPTGGSISVPAYSGTSVTITTGNYSDGGSGIASNVITRSNGQSPVGGVCPAVGTFTGSTVVSSPDSGVVDGQCYVYTLTGTDNVGNSVSVASSTVLVDATAPSDSFSIVSASGAYKAGASIFYNGNSAGSFTLRDTETDGASGPASATFGAMSAAGFTTHNAETVSTPPGGPYDSTAIQWTSSSASPTIAAHGTDAAGNSSTATTFNLLPDNNAPTGGSVAVPAYVTSLSVTITSSSYSDAGSGIASNVVTRSNAQPPAAGVCPASGYTGSTVVSSPDTGVANGQCYVYTLTGTDNVGNTASVTSSPVLVDTTAPADAISITGATGAYKSGTTVYYKGNAAGSFKLQDNVTDGISGPASATFGALTGGSGFSTHNSETVSTPAGGPYDATAISWSSASGSPTIPVHSTDAAGNSSGNTTLTLTNDTTAPTGGSISVPSYAAAISVAITSSNYSDGGSGIASNVMTRSNAQAPVAGVCPASGYTGANAVSSPDLTVADGECYVYTLTGTDNVGNTAAVASSPVLVDVTAPADSIAVTGVSGGVHQSGTTVYYNGGAAGSFTLEDTVGDGASGPASATFGTLTGLTGASHTTETVSGSSPYDSTAISWSSASGSGSLPVHSTDAAGNSSSDTTLTLTNDTTAPTGGSISVPAYSGTSVTITTGNYSDGGSGIASNVITRSNGQSPVGGVCPAVGTFTGSTVVSSPDSGVVDGQCYVYTLTGTDNVGNTVSVASGTVMVDATAPVDALSLTGVSGGVYKNGTTVYYKGNASGGFKVRDTATDGTSGTASATFGTLSGLTGASHTTETVSGSSPYDSTAISWSSASGSGSLPVHSTDAAGNSSADTTLTLTLDNTGPTGGSISVPATVNALSVAITSTSFGDSGSGIASNVITRSNGQAPSGGACPGSGYSGSNSVSSPDLTVADGECYVYTLTGTDNVGNTSTVSSSPVLVDTTSPTDAFSLTAVSGGAYRSGSTIYYRGNAAGSFKLRDTVSDGGSGPASATFGTLSGVTGASHTAETVSGSSPYDSTAISWTSATGTGSMNVHSTDGAGNSSNDTSFSLTDDSTAPALGVTAPVANAHYGGTTAYPTFWNGTATDGGAGVNSVQLSIKDPNGQYWNAGAFSSGIERMQNATASAGTWSYSNGVNGAPAGLTTNGVYTVHIVLTDNVGNQTSSTFTFTYDNVAPTYASSATDAGGTHVTLTLTEATSGLDTSSTTPTSAFTVNVNGVGAAITGLSYLDATHIRLTLGQRVYGDDSVTVAYSQTSLTTAQKVKDLAGNLLGSLSAQTVSVAATPSLTQTTISPSPSTITADGTSTTTITVTLRNGAGSALPASGGTVTLQTTAGSLSSVTDNGDGTYTATLTSTTLAQTATVTGRLDGQDLTSSPTVTFAPGAPAQLAFGTEPQSSVTAGATLSPVTVDVLDANGNLVTSSSAAVTLDFATNPGSATLGGTATKNAVAGVATFDDLSIEQAAAGYSFSASATGVSAATSTTFTVDPDNATTIAASAGDSQSATVNTDVATSPSVLVTDEYGNPVAGVAVTFAVASGGGGATGTSATTDATGLASVGSWLLGLGAGSNTLTASATGLTGSPVTFHATGTPDAPANLTIAAGDGQSATVATAVGAPPSVLVTDQYGNPVAGVGVTFAVTSGGGSGTGLGQSTDASGNATVGSWTLGATAGTNSMTASATGLGSVTFHATGVADSAYSMTASAGDSQSATVNTAVAVAPSVLVTDQHGNPVSGVAVTFSVATGGGSITGANTTTDASGIATVGSWTLGTAAGSDTLTASATGLADVTFDATATADAATTIAVAAGDNQHATVNTAVATDPSVLVTDQYGNPVQGVNVTFAVASGGGSATGLVESTAADGTATVGSWTLGTAVGANTLTATSTGLTGSPITFNATGDHDVLDHLVVSPATASISADIGSEAYTAEGRDQYENSLGDVTSSTTFTVTGGSCVAATCTVTAAGSHTVTGTMLGATGNASLTVTAGAPYTLSANGGDNQIATAHTAVGTDPSVLVTDQYGNPVGGVSVTFSVTTGGGSLTGASATTDASGVATVGSWTLGTAAGSNSLTASVSGLTDVVFHATAVADAASAISAAAGDGQSATVGTAVSTNPSVLVTDEYGNPVAGVAVTFAVASGGGNATGLSATTDASGNATVGSWTLGTAAGSNTLTASAAGLTGSPVTFHATGTADAATAIAAAGGDSQSATVHTALATDPSVLVTDQYGNPVAGVAVTFAVASGGGSATGTSATTDATGTAAVGSWTLGTAAGSNTLTASASGLAGSPITFHATGDADAPSTMAASAGDSQSATVGTDVSTAPSVAVTDQYGNPVSGVAVTFAVASGGGSVTGANATTDAGGIAAVGSWQLGTTAGSNTITASASGLSPVTFHATGLAGAPGSMTIDAGEGQTATVNTNLSTAPSVLVTDANGNPVQGVSVTFSVASGGGSVTGATTTTGADGVATVGSWKLGTGAGSNTLSVTSTGLPSITFHATATADAASVITVASGDNQTATVDTDVSSAPQVLVTDQYGNPVSAVSVTFGVAGGGGSITGAVQATDSNGLASVGSWKLGTAAGTNSLTATSTGLGGSPITFHATGVAGSA
ncbi:MAG TPA: invasin domain 3-containing protein, partial [Gaiellaceae bacterium]|nr:invasin domain 3-containing protein [Gaiellaceae bacterium]